MKYKINCSMLGALNKHYLRDEIVDAAELKGEGVDIDRLLGLGAVVVAEDDDEPVETAETLDLMTKAQLLEIAVGLGIEDVGKRTPNADLIELIRAAQAPVDDAKDEGPDGSESGAQE